jgi:hypothetical protein
MALLFLDSFDHYATADVPVKYTAVGGAATIAAGAGRRSSACALFSNANVTPVVTPSGNVAIVGVAYKQGSGTFANGDWQGIEIFSGATVQLGLTLSPTGFLKVVRGGYLSGAPGLLGTASSALTLGVFQFIELKATIHPTAGTVVVRVDEAVVLNLTGVNTAQTGVAGWSGLRLSSMQAGSSSNSYDDLYVLDGSGAAPLNDLLGDCRVDARYPTAAGATTQWTPSTGANWQNVDDAAPNGDTDYNSTATVGATDTFTTQDAPVVGGTLYGAQVVLSAKKTVAGTCSIAPVIRHAGTDYPGTAANPNTSYGFAVLPYGTNPGTGAAWTEAGFNAAEFGYKRTA